MTGADYSYSLLPVYVKIINNKRIELYVRNTTKKRI